jgi:predicted nucleotide-binding protein
MFNFIVFWNEEAWDKAGSQVLEKSRVAIEYTADEISERYKNLDEKTIEEIKSFPTVFAIEGEEINSKIGRITNINVLDRKIEFHYEFTHSLPSIPAGTLNDLKRDLDIRSLELFRTHWAIKDVDLFAVLSKHNLISSEHIRIFNQENPTKISRIEPKAPENAANLQQVFIVHGHDEITKLKVSDFIKDIGLEPIILHEQANQGMTIIEKIEHYSNVGFALILYTECDIGAKKHSLTYHYRARQNVIFEHGYLIGKLGRDKVAAIVKGEVETPNDISGVVYISMDEQEQWKQQITKELSRHSYT